MKIEKHLLAIFSIITVLIQRMIHRKKDDVYALGLSMNELALVKNGFKNMKVSDDAESNFTKNKNDLVAGHMSLHTRDRLCQHIDDCLSRLKNIQHNLKNDRDIALRTINRVDVELERYK